MDVRSLTPELKMAYYHLFIDNILANVQYFQAALSWFLARIPPPHLANGFSYTPVISKVTINDGIRLIMKII